MGLRNGSNCLYESGMSGSHSLYIIDMSGCHSLQINFINYYKFFADLSGGLTTASRMTAHAAGILLHLFAFPLTIGWPFFLPLGVWLGSKLTWWKSFVGSPWESLEANSSVCL